MSRPIVPILALALVAGVARADDAATTVVVVPYAPLFGDMPQSTGDKAAKYVADEVGANKAFQVQELNEGRRTADKRTGEDDVAAAAKEIEEAQALFQKATDLAKAKPPKVKPAADNFEKGIQQFLVNFQGANDFKPLSDAYVQLAIARFKLGDETEAFRLLDDVVRVDPDRVLAPPEVVPLFAKLHEKARKAYFAKDRGQLRVLSTPAGARVSLDGRELGETPLLARDVLPGEHYVRVVKPGQGAFWKKVKITSGEEVSLTADLAGEPSGLAATIAHALQENTLDAKTVDSLRKVADHSKADFVVFGALLKQDDNMAVRSWALRAKDGKLTELSQLLFDMEMVGAAIEVFKLASDLEAKVKEFPGEEPSLPLALFADAKPAGAEAKVAEVRVTPGDGSGSSRGDGQVDGSGRGRRRVVAQSAEATEERKPIAEEKKPDEPVATDSGLVVPHRRRVKIGEEPPPPVKKVEEEKEPELVIRKDPAAKADIVSATIAEEDETPKAKPETIDLNVPKKRVELSDLSPEELKRLQDLEQEGQNSGSGNGLLWGAAGVGAAAVVGAGVYFLFLSSGEPTSATARISWQP